jgi:hypothetical protein
MFSFSDTWGMYQDMKTKRRQRERDDINNERYEDQLQQQSLANTRADEQLRLNQGTAARQNAAVTLEKQRYDANAPVRANALTQQEQSITTGKQQIAANTESAKATKFAQLGKQAQNLVFIAGKEGAQQALNNPTHMPVVEDLIGDLLVAGEYLPEGTTFAGFEETQGPSRDGKGTKVFVPMMVDANGQKTDIGQMLGGDGADSFTAEQIVSFIERGSQQYYGVNTSTGLEAAAMAPEANAGEDIVASLATNTQGSGGQQQQTGQTQTGQTQSSLGTPGTEETVMDQGVAFPSTGLTSSTVQNGSTGDSGTDLAPGYTGLNVNQGLGRGLGQGYDAIKNTIQGAGREMDRLFPGTVDDVIAEVKDIASGFTGSNKPAATTPLAATKVNANSSLNTKSSAKQEEEIKKTPPTVEEQAKVQTDNITGARAQQAAGKKRPTQEQRDQRAWTIAVRRANGETISAKQQESYINTGFLEGTKVANVTIGYTEYEQHIDPEGIVTYKALGASGAAITAMNKADVALTKARMTEVDEWYKQAAPTAMSAAGVKVVDDGKKASHIGPYMNQSDFHLTARQFIESHAGLLKSTLGFDPKDGPQNLGQKRLLTGIMTAYAKSVSASKAGAINYTSADNFSSFLKAHSGESGNYLIGNKLVNIDDQVDIEMANLPAGSTTTSAEVRAEQLKTLKAMQGPL